LRRHHGAALRAALQRTQLEYVLFTIQADGQTARFPLAGWLKGGIAELALLVHRSSIPSLAGRGIGGCTGTRSNPCSNEAFIEPPSG
jgi:hypothetical protein